MAKRRSSTSKSARRRANQSLKERQRASVAQEDSSDVPFDDEVTIATRSTSPCKQSSARPRVEIPQPHPHADPEAALNAVAEYRQALKHWQSLPFWKRLVTPRPQHPTGI